MPVERRIVVRDGDHVREVLLVGTVTVGRSPSCEISSADPRLSRAHATFEVVGDDVVVRDLESRNGTRVNGEKITEHRLVVGDDVEVGPFALQLIEIGNLPSSAQRPPVEGNDEATVLRPRRADPTAPPMSPPAAAPPSAPAPVSESDDRTRLRRRPPAPAGPQMPPAAPVSAPASARAGARRAPPLPSKGLSAATPTASSAELTFGRATLLWVVPLALVSFLAGLVPDLLQPDDRTPLLQAHYEALATSAVELVRVSREPAQPLDAVTSALRRHGGVVLARIMGADGRVLAPMNDAGTSVVVPPTTGAVPRVTDAAAGHVALQVAAITGDGRAVVVALDIDPSAIHPAPAGSPIGTLLLLVCLGAAWLVARRITDATNGRLSRLGEEVELMTTRQVSVGSDPFRLPGARRILDAVTFALSPAGRPPGDAPLSTPRLERGPVSRGAEPTGATIEADAGFRILAADAGCEALLGLSPEAALGQHLIDALQDQAIVDEVLRLVTLATPERVAQGTASPGGGRSRLGIDVTRGSGGGPLIIRFKRV